MRTFEFRLYPNKDEARFLMGCLAESRKLNTEMLETVKAQYEDQGTFPTKYDLTAQFKGRSAGHAPATTVQMLADRLSKSLKRFLEARELGVPSVGFPRFKPPNRWHSIKQRQYGTSRDVWLDADNKHLHVPAKIGKSLKIKVHRPIEGAPKTVHLVHRSDGHWYALIVCETEPPTEHAPSACQHPAIGIDVGLKSLLTDSDGHTVKNPRFYRNSQQTLRRKQRRMCRRKKGSHRRRKAARSTAQTHLKIARQRRDFQYKTANQYTEQYQVIAVEQLHILNLVQNHSLAKSISDASWGAFLDILSEKAERAGHAVIRVNPRFTSQKCFKCDEIVQKSLSVRTHICPCCGYVADRDVTAAQNILKLARPGHGLQEPTYTDGCRVS